MAFRISNEAKIGAFVLVALALLIIGYNYLEGNDLFTRQTLFYAKYSDAEGLTPSNPVRIKGIAVGRVTRMDFIPSTNSVVVKFSVRSNIRVPIGSVARIVSADLLGSKALNIELSNNASYYRTADTLPSGTQQSLSNSVRAEILPVKEKAEALLGSIDSVLTTVRTILNPETRARIVSSISSIQHTLETLDKSSQNFDALLRNNTSRMEHIFANVEAITANLSNNEALINSMMTNLNAITDSVRRANITQTFNKTKAVLEQTQNLLDKINRGEGSMGLLVNDKKLYNDLDNASKNLSELLDDLKRHPGRYVHISVFGKKEREVPFDTTKK